MKIFCGLWRCLCRRVYRMIYRVGSSPSPFHPSPVIKLSLLLSLLVCRRRSSFYRGRGGKGVGKEPNNSTARKPGPFVLYTVNKGPVSNGWQRKSLFYWIIASKVRYCITQRILSQFNISLIEGRQIFGMSPPVLYVVSCLAISHLHLAWSYYWWPKGPALQNWCWWVIVNRSLVPTPKDCRAIF
jgi:hypothetical protein